VGCLSSPADQAREPPRHRVACPAILRHPMPVTNRGAGPSGC
jgi:hypothetical protein